MRGDGGFGGLAAIASRRRTDTRRIGHVTQRRRVVVDAVSSELVSEANSLVTGNLQGILRLVGHPPPANRPENACRLATSRRAQPALRKIEQGIFGQVSGKYHGGSGNPVAVTGNRPAGSFTRRVVFRLFREAKPILPLFLGCEFYCHVTSSNL